ncbi:MAG TPA: hypothetical protein PKM21_13030 [Anaerolineales bacterium]|nr:hypothetical protein [Anaerolineales bacterium]
MQPIEVTAHFSIEGKATPLRFTWKNSVYQIESTGRRWTNEDGLHILVMALGGRMFELLFVCTEGRWYLARAETGRLVA